ncbi:NAD(P)/FAD-dependent oxidoreductase [Aspergillus tanneri]|uniref:FAD dependent oxidoreductase domain-containing protein n=1 Tax=Aspergillus tanneri TaxID=1220188 RepID=A0A5M9M6V9_9EURO|nr:uncharacterized protein ATNIH1004_011483 [Aspergillus tanneri]KAA8642538.1 hypothetical protein ATNIH1004_011483 [Aspergillus tanneri]
MAPSLSVKDLITVDPGLPNQHPTQSHWQHIPHALSNTQSPSLPQKTDIAIIGSGITSLSVCKTLLESHPSMTITLLEARALCSGATGRNGGQLATNAGEEYQHLARTHGAEMAGKIVQFTWDNLQRMRTLSLTYAGETSELQDVQKLRVFLTSKVFKRFKDSMDMLETDHPSFRGTYTIVSAEELKQEYNISGAGGALLPAGTIWPYRLVTTTFASLLDKYKSRISIETHTPVTAVNYTTEESSCHPYILHTTRGTLRAGKIAYCTNGYSGHLLPRLRGLIYPFKGTMTVQVPGAAAPNRGEYLSWGFHYPAVYDACSMRYAAGLYYLMQNAKTGYYYFGGEDTRVDLCLSADDSRIDEDLVQKLQAKSVFVGDESQGHEPRTLVSAWTGVMGFSADGMPVVGQLPSSLTGRKGEGEYIAAAFNGYGMANCLLSGEALAKMMLGEGVSEWLPAAYGIHDGRLKELLTVDHAVRSFERHT